MFLLLSRCVPFIFTNRRGRNKPTGISVASFHAKNAIARYMQANEYFIKLVNNSYAEEKANLIIDIYPCHNCYHPERHFGYFAIDVIIGPRNSKLIKMVYNWQGDIAFFVNEEKIKIINSWIGNMKDSELYMICAVVKNLGGQILDNKVNILQLLKL